MNTLAQFRWIGHLIRMNDSRLPKIVCELQDRRCVSWSKQSQRTWLDDMDSFDLSRKDRSLGINWEELRDQPVNPSSPRKWLWKRCMCVCVHVCVCVCVRVCVRAHLLRVWQKTHSWWCTSREWRQWSRRDDGIRSSMTTTTMTTTLLVVVARVQMSTAASVCVVRRRDSEHLSFTVRPVCCQSSHVIFTHWQPHAAAMSRPRQQRPILADRNQTMINAQCITPWISA